MLLEFIQYQIRYAQSINYISVSNYPSLLLYCILYITGYSKLVAHSQSQKYGVISLLCLIQDECRMCSVQDEWGHLTEHA